MAQSTGALKTAVRLEIVDATTPQAAVAAVDRLVKELRVPAILGTYGSTLAAAASERAEQLKTVYWETGAVADPITAQRHYVFRTVATGSSLGRMAVNFTHDVLIPGARLASPRVVVVRVNDIYGRSVGSGEQALAATLRIDVVDVIEYNPLAFDADVIAERVAADRADFLWDVSYLDDGVAIWSAILRRHVPLKGAIGTSSAFCMPDFGKRLVSGVVGVYAADKPDADISVSALSPAGRALLERARAAFAVENGGSVMSIPAVAGFVGGWTLFHDVLPRLSGAPRAESIRATALAVDVPTGDAIKVVGVTEHPALARLERPDDRVVRVDEMPGRVLVLRVVAAADVAAGHAEPQVNPRVAGGQAFLAAVGCVGLDITDLVEVRTGSRARHQ